MSEQIRQLAVIMFTDIVGYTAMMGEDEARAFSLLKANRNIHKKCIGRYKGKCLKEMGDGFLASFTSVSDAIYCAGAIQKESASDPDLNLRIGIHMGEVIVEVGDVFGDGVNIASRIESQARPGSIYVSDAVYRNLTNKKGVEAEFVKEEQLKNVKHPVRIYEVSVDLPDEVEPDPSIREDNIESDVKQGNVGGWRKPLTIGMAAVLLIVISYFAFSYFGQTANADNAETRTIIVLPFDNLGSPDDEYFANGITDEITSRLGLIKSFSIISPLSASRFKESGKSMEELADDLDVDFVLDGSIRWDKENKSQRVRITPRLTDVSNNRQMWTNSFDRDIEQIFEVQSEIAERVAQALDVNILQSERRSLQVKLTDNIKAYDLYLQGKDASSDMTITTGFRLAEQYFEEAITLDPEFAAAYARLGANHADFWWHYIDRDSTRIIKAKACIDKANELNPDLFEVKLASALIYYHAFREYKRALDYLADAQAMKPNNSEVFNTIGLIKRRQGEFNESNDYILKAFNLDPLSSSIALTLAETYTLIRDYDNSIKFFDKGKLLMPEWYGTYSRKALANYLQKGEIEACIEIIKYGLKRSIDTEVLLFDLAYYYHMIKEYDQALLTLDKIEPKQMNIQFKYYSKFQYRGDIYLAMGKNDLALIYYDSARIFVEQKILEDPFEAQYHSSLGIIYARLGMNNKAIEEGLKGTSLMPESLDAWIGYERQLDLARIYSINGDTKLALDKIDYLLSTPGNFSTEMLSLDPIFNNLKNENGYQEIMENSNYRH